MCPALPGALGTRCLKIADPEQLLLGPKKSGTEDREPGKLGLDCLASSREVHLCYPSAKESRAGATKTQAQLPVQPWANHFFYLSASVSPRRMGIMTLTYLTGVL